MTTVLLPVGKIVYVCDDVVADPVSHKPSILNFWEVVRVPAEASFPYTLEKLCVVALISDGQGGSKVPGRCGLSRHLGGYPPK